MKTALEVCHECGAESLRPTYGDDGESGPFDLFCDSCGYEVYVPAEAKSRTRIDAVRAIARNHLAARIDGFIVDAQTASLLVQAYEKMSPYNQERFGEPDLGRLADLVWRCARRTA